MRIMKSKCIVLAALFLATLSSGAASKVRLVYGEKWSQAGRAVKETLQSSEWKSRTSSAYLTEFVDDSGEKPAAGNLGSLKLPCIFVLDEKDRCYCVIENVPYNSTAEKLYRKIVQVDKKRTEIAKQYGTDTIDGCGLLMLAMEKYVGGPKRVISEGFYKDVFEKLEKLDPQDESGWRRHFTMGDGIEIVTKANEFREDKDFKGGAAYIDNQMRLPAKHLTVEQKQSLLMAKFALYREDTTKREEMLALLRKVAEADEATLWGTAAVGWLNIMKEPLFSVYWGWRKGDFPTGTFRDKKLKYGVQPAFPKAGTYTISFNRTDGPRVDFSSVTLYCGEEEIAKLTQQPFEVKITKGQAGRVTHMMLAGNSGGETACGTITIERNILRPRKEVK